MGRTLRDDLWSDLDNMLNTSEFAEVVTYYPKLGTTPREVVMLIEETTAYEQRPQGEESLLSLIVTCSRNPQGAKGGVQWFAIDDVIHRARDPDDLFYVYAGEILDGSNFYKTRARFHRVVTKRVGGMHLDRI